MYALGLASTEVLLRMHLLQYQLLVIRGRHRPLQRSTSPAAQGSWGPPAGRRRWRHRLWWRTGRRLRLAAGPRSLGSSSSPQCPPPPPAAWDGPAHCKQGTRLSALAQLKDGLEQVRVLRSIQVKATLCTFPYFIFQNLSYNSLILDGGTSSLPVSWRPQLAWYQTR